MQKQRDIARRRYIDIAHRKKEVLLTEGVAHRSKVTVLTAAKRYCQRKGMEILPKKRHRDIAIEETLHYNTRETYIYIMCTRRGIVRNELGRDNARRCNEILLELTTTYRFQRQRTIPEKAPTY